MDETADNRLVLATFADEFPMTPARQAVVALVRAFGTLQRQMGSYFARFGLTPPQFQTLTIVNRLEVERLTQRRLARELYVSFPNVTIMLARLEEAGLIRRRTNPRDRREKFIVLSAAGRARLLRVWRHHEQQLERVISGLDDGERRTLHGLLAKFVAANQPDRDAQRRGRASPRKSVGTRKAWERGTLSGGDQ